MMARPNLFTLWPLLLLLHVAGSAERLNMFQRTPGPVEGDVRLVGSSDDSEGRVEVYHDGRWGTVCDDGWGMAEAQVVCRQLQFPGVTSAMSGIRYGEASGRIWLDDVKCSGTESRISACDFRRWGVTDCSHKEDVGVICQRPDAVNSTNTVDHSILLSGALGHIFDSGRGCDVLIVVQSTTGDGRKGGSREAAEATMCLHRIIVSQIPFFDVSEETANITVNVSQSCRPHLTSLIRYIYTRKLDVNLSSVQCLHSLASKFGLNQLMEDLGRLFSQIFPVDASFGAPVSFYKYAAETGDLFLQESCLQYLAWNFQYLAGSPAWTGLSTELLGALLSSSDLVVPDEYSLLQSVEGWITERGPLISSEAQVDLLSRIRFPMIPAEKLYALKVNSSLYSAHERMYRDNILKALEFNVLLFRHLLSNPKFDKEEDDYQPRIYTAEPWSAVVDPSKTPTKTFETPAHSSLIFSNNNKFRWEAKVTMQRDCSSQGLKCKSLPLAWLAQQNGHGQRNNVAFRNRLLVTCRGKFVCEVKDFTPGLAQIAVNGTRGLAYPCPDDQYAYRFVVRPEYV